MVIMCFGLRSTCSPPKTFITSMLTWGGARTHTSSAGTLPSSHSTTGTSVVRTALADGVVGDQELARISVECLERHPGRCEEVLADGYEAPRREWVRAACEPAEDPRLHVVQGFVRHSLLEQVVHHADVDAKLIRAVRAHVGGKI